MDERIEVLDNSPIEFVVFGPRGGRDEILLRSSNAGLDIIGLAAEKGMNREYVPFSASIISLFFGAGRQMNIIESHKTDDLDPESDDRVSAFQFAWVGLCSPVRRERIEHALNKSLADLRSALRKDDRSQIEMAIAPIVLACSRAHERRQRSRRFMWMTLVIYAAIGIGALIFGLVTDTLK